MAATLQEITVQAISKHTQVLICYFTITLHRSDMEVVGFKASLSSDVVNRKKDTDNVTTIDYHTIY
jgi:FlaG/FlaF family flagellin (archaellin)